MMLKLRKLRPATRPEIAHPAHGMVEILPERTPVSWPFLNKPGDPDAPDWCCHGCARWLLTGWNNSAAGMLIRCMACDSIGVIPPRP